MQKQWMSLLSPETDSFGRSQLGISRIKVDSFACEMAARTLSPFKVSHNPLLLFSQSFSLSVPITLTTSHVHTYERSLSTDLQPVDPDHPILILTSHLQLHFLTVIMSSCHQTTIIALRDQSQRNLPSYLAFLSREGGPIIPAIVFCFDLFVTANLLHLIEEQHHAQKYHICVYDCHNTMQTFPASRVSMSFAENF